MNSNKSETQKQRCYCKYSPKVKRVLIPLNEIFAFMVGIDLHRSPKANSSTHTVSKKCSNKGCSNTKLFLRY